MVSFPWVLKLMACPVDRCPDKVKCVLKFTVPEATNACKDDQICSRLKVGIEGAVHRVQVTWYSNLSMVNWGFLLVDAKNVLNEIIFLECCGRFSFYGRLEIVF